MLSTSWGYSSEELQYCSNFEEILTWRLPGKPVVQAESEAVGRRPLLRALPYYTGNDDQDVPTTRQDCSVAMFSIYGEGRRAFALMKRSGIHRHPYMKSFNPIKPPTRISLARYTRPVRGGQKTCQVSLTNDTAREKYTEDSIHTERGPEEHPKNQRDNAKLRRPVSWRIREQHAILELLPVHRVRLLPRLRPRLHLLRKDAFKLALPPPPRIRR